jgi:deazaflavin-dependent oxidoreductase (nitroreductase family)
MDDAVRAALATDRTVDITTTGRRSGTPRRIETWLYRAGDRFYLTGLPGPRSWYANLVASPAFTLHLKRSLAADLPATARPVTDDAERRAVIRAIIDELDGDRDYDAWVAGAPLAEITFV